MSCSCTPMVPPAGPYSIALPWTAGLNPDVAHTRFGRRPIDESTFIAFWVFPASVPDLVLHFRMLPACSSFEEEIDAPVFRRRGSRVLITQQVTERIPWE